MASSPQVTGKLNLKKKINMDITYNTPVKVSEAQYNRLCKEANGFLAFAKDEEGYWVKLMVPAMRKHLNQLLNG